MSISDNDVTRVTLNCPTWCTADHRGGPDVDEVNDLVSHSLEIGRVAAIDTEASVGVAATDVYELDGAGVLAPIQRGIPTVYLYGAEEMTPGQARSVAELLMKAATVAQQLAEQGTAPEAVPSATVGERPARPGETCTCGRPAVKVFITEKWGETGYCGIPDGGAR